MIAGIFDRPASRHSVFPFQIVVEGLYCSAGLPETRGGEDTPITAAPIRNPEIILLLSERPGLRKEERLPSRRGALSWI